MYAPDFQHLLHYKISIEPGGVRLRMWELAVGSTSGGKSYLYIINYRLNSLDEAKDSLRQHLSLNGGILTQDQDLPPKGQITLVPHPTLEIGDQEP